MIINILKKGCLEILLDKSNLPLYQAAQTFSEKNQVTCLTSKMRLLSVRPWTYVCLVAVVITDTFIFVNPFSLKKGIHGTKFWMDRKLNSINPNF